MTQHDWLKKVLYSFFQLRDLFEEKKSIMHDDLFVKNCYALFLQTMNVEMFFPPDVLEDSAVYPTHVPIVMLLAF